MLAFITTLQALMADRKNDDKGATAVEYALMVSLIAVAIVTAVTGLATRLIAIFGEIVAAI